MSNKFAEEIKAHLRALPDHLASSYTVRLLSKAAHVLELQHWHCSAGCTKVDFTLNCVKCGARAVFDSNCWCNTLIEKDKVK